MKSEREKMLAGELYLASDPELVAARLRAQALLAEFNVSAPDAEEERRTLLTSLLARLGEVAAIMPAFKCDYGFNISIGDRSFLNYDCIFLDCNMITIGDDVQIAPGVHIYTATHPVEAEPRLSGLEYALPVSVGHGAWIGGGSIICPGVSIGEHCVVGAGSVVTSDLPASVVAAGNPCRIIRQL